MILNYSCPLCKFKNWSPVQKYIYNVRDHLSFSSLHKDKYISRLTLLRSLFYTLIYAAPKPKNISVRTLTSYERLRRKVLFDIWFPGKEQVILTSQYCMNCGFMAYTPRPTEKDLEAKYEFLYKNSAPEEIEEYTFFLEKDPYSKRNREMIYELVTDEIIEKKLKVLDYGGANGWYLLPFLEHNHECELIDYESEQLPGIKKIGNEIHEIPSDSMYDAIICRAILEHVADPLSIVNKFHNILHDNGVIFAMVPDEILGGISRLGPDPVTHINFFTPKSFELLFKLADFEIVGSDTDEMNNIWILARKAQNRGTFTHGNEIIDTEQLLKPRRTYIIKKVFLNRIRLFYLRNFH